MTDVTQTDVSRPSALPSARLRNKPSQAQALVEQNSSEYLDAVEEEWNKKIDTEVETLVDGMVDIVNLASVSTQGMLVREKTLIFVLDWRQRQVQNRAGGIPCSVSCRINGGYTHSKVTRYVFQTPILTTTTIGSRGTLAIIHHSLA